MITSYIIHTLILYYFFSPSLLFDQLLVKHSMKMSLQLLCFLAATLFLECFLFHASMVIQFTFTSFESSLFFPLTSLGSSLRFWARSRVIGRSRACLFLFRFQILFAFLSLFFLSLARKKLATGFDPSPLRISRSCRLLTPKTTVPWPVDHCYPFSLYLVLCLIGFELRLYWGCRHS